MSVLIKGMDMPKSCGECNDRHIYDLMWKLGLCHDADTDDYSGCVCVGRANCPLEELPPHGDLIERDALYKEIEERWGCSAYTGLTFSLHKVTNAPTVLEAEG